MYYTLSGKEYWVQDLGEGTPIVFLHGFTGSSKTWESLIDNWKTSYRFITMDLPGHGKTNIEKAVSMKAFCKDLALLFELLAIEKAHLVGYSMGGRTALSFAMLYPKKVATLVLESASPGLKASHDQLARQAKDEVLAKKIEEEGVAAFVDYWENIPLFDTQKHLPQPVRQKVRKERLNQSEKGLAASLRGMGTGKQPSWWDQLASLPMETLLIVGALDEKFVQLAKQMNNSFKNSRLNIVTNAGHAVHVEQARIFDTIVSDFIKSK